MRIATWQRIALVAFSAGLQVVIFPIAGPLPVWRSWLAWIALTPLLLAILVPGKDGRPLSIWQSTHLAYLGGSLFYAGNCYWIYQTMYLYAGVNKPVALVLLLLFSLYLGLYHALFGFLLRLAAGDGRRIGLALLASPFLWVAVELARAHITSFPWDQLGMSQIDHPRLVSVAPFAGVYAVSFLLAAASAVIAAMLLLPRKQWATPATAFVFLLIALFAVPLPRSSAYASQSAVLLQPNGQQNDDRAWTGIGYAQQMQQFIALSEHPPLGPQEQASADVIIWPESPSPLFEQDPRFQAAAAQLARATGSALILGNVARAQSPGQTAVYNSASFFTSEGQPAGRYDKIHLVPFGEYIPFQELLTFARALTANAGDMSPGRERVMFSNQGHRYGVFICYESIFADEVRQFAKNGAGVLVNISDDGWYGDTSAPWQHLNMARMRAIENNRWLLRDTNSGVTATIDPTGKLVASAPRHAETAIRVPFAFVNETTFYTRHGDVFACAVTLIGVVFLCFSQFKRAS